MVSIAEALVLQIQSQLFLVRRTDVLLTRLLLLSTQPKVLIQDWDKDDQSQRRVKSTVEKILDQNIPDSYDRCSSKRNVTTYLI